MKISIQPYSSGVGGVTVVDNETIGNLGVRSKNEFLGDLKVLYAGMVAEEIILGETSNGSSNDLERATALIKEFVGSYGMSDGLLLSLNSLSNDNPLMFSNKDFLDRMQTIAEGAYKETRAILSNIDSLKEIERLAYILIDKEVIYDLT